MKNKKTKTFIYEGFGFPIKLIKAPMRKILGEWAIDINFNELEKVVLHILINKPSALNGAELRFIRKYLRMTTTDFGKLFGLSHAAISKWENEKAQIPALADFYIRLHMLCHLDGNREIHDFHRRINPNSLTENKVEDKAPISINIEEDLKTT